LSGTGRGRGPGEGSDDRKSGTSPKEPEKVYDGLGGEGVMFGFSSIGPFELLLILVVALVVFGPKKLPEIGRAIGQAIRSFKEQSEKLTQELTLDEAAAPPPPAPPAAEAAAAPPALPAGPESPLPAPAPRARKKRKS
jgi:sec-independent protein translocase protein TatA